MNTAESNEKKNSQVKQASESPAKSPETETAHMKPHDVAKAAEAGRGASPSTSDSGDESGTLAKDVMSTRPRGQDVLNDDSLDDTVDTDGKNRDAKRDMEMRERNPDAVVMTDATLVNHVREPGDGLGGFDSRPGRNGLLLLLERGYRMIDRGMVAPPVREVEQHLQYETRDSHGHTLRGRKHYALNHMRPSRLIELQFGEK